MTKSLSISSSLHLPIISLLLTIQCGYTVRADACDPNPCQNGGTCSVVMTLGGVGPSCSCSGGSRGKDDYCNLSTTTAKANPCDPNPCESGGTCVEDPNHEYSAGDFKCMCGTDRDGETCEIETGRPAGDFKPFAY